MSQQSTSGEWVLEALERTRVVDARERTAKGLDGSTCRRFAAHADVNRVAEAVAGAGVGGPEGP